MVTIDGFRQLILYFDNVTEQPHFEKASFRIGKKILATLNEKKNQVVVKLSETDQSVFCAYDKAVIYPVNGGWGRQGWTVVELEKVQKNMLKDMLKTAYGHLTH
jgi:uncharacterized protein (DUF927 family)